MFDGWITDLTSWFIDFVDYIFWTVVGFGSDILLTMFESVLDLIPDSLTMLPTLISQLTLYFDYCEYFFPLSFFLSILGGYWTLRISVKVINLIIQMIPCIG